MFYLKLNVPINCLAAGVECPAPGAILRDISDTAILETSPLARPAHLALPMKRGNPSLHLKLPLENIFYSSGSNGSVSNRDSGSSSNDNIDNMNMQSDE